ncbi:hypothetical protein L7F22_027444 [Adiantum nelumboides]|nr:hypothetical protein [Adiantum nelumboides]
MMDVLVNKGLAAPLKDRKESMHNDDQWEELDARARATIWLHLRESIFFTIMDKTTAFELWDSLCSAWDGKGASNKVFLMKKLMRLSMKEGSSVSSHLNEFNALNLQLTSKGLNFDDEMKAIFLLCSLPALWNTFNTAICNSTHGGKLAFGDVTSALLTEENRHKSLDNGGHGNAGPVSASLQLMLLSPRVLFSQSVAKKEHVFAVPSQNGRSLGCFYTCIRSCARCAALAEVVLDDLQSASEAGLASYGSLIRSCGDAKIWKHSMLAHHIVIEHGLAHVSFLQGLLVQMYGKCGSLDHALNVFCAMPEHSAFSWNFITRASAQQGYYQEALDLFNQMQQEVAAPDKFTYVCAVTACTGKGDLRCNMQMHARIVKSGIESDMAIGTAMINMYGKCGRVSDAKSNYEKMSEQDVISWNVILSIYAERDQTKQALQLFSHMHQQSFWPTHVTYFTMLDVCAVRCGSVEYAQKLFDSISSQSTMAWNTMISVYSQRGSAEEAFQLFALLLSKVQTPTRITFVSMLGACIDNVEGRTLHALITESSYEAARRDLISWNTMIAAFALDERLVEAFGLLEQMVNEGITPEKVTYTTILEACVHYEMPRVDIPLGSSGLNGEGEGALSAFDCEVSKHSILQNVRRLFYEGWHGDDGFKHFLLMQQWGVLPNKVTYVSALEACVAKGSLFEGKNLHACICGGGFLSKVPVITALIDMYSKCGKLDDAWVIFAQAPSRDNLLWNFMISLYSQHGDVPKALKIFDLMAKEGVMADKVTFISTLTACSHCGLIEDGFYWLSTLLQDHCLGMPFQPTEVPYIMLLHACQQGAEVNYGGWAATHSFELGGENTAPYVLLANIPYGG